MKFFLALQLQPPGFRVQRCLISPYYRLKAAQTITFPTMNLLRTLLVLSLLVHIECFAPRLLQASVVASAPSEASTLFMSEDSNSDEEEAPPVENVRCPDCDLCDGSGRIVGGIGAVATWWPIKAYRPCPNFIDRGGQYQRSGQGLDEIAFGRDSTFKRDS